MNKKEKYINFIVDDLISKTEVTNTPFDREITFPFQPYIFFNLYIPHDYKDSFNKHVSSQYGVRESEYGILWNLYKERIGRLVNE